MPHLFSGLNQKRQGGKITNGTFVIGNTKSRGSSTRILNNCSKTRENSQNCLYSIINIAPAMSKPDIQNLEGNNDLFNRISFSEYFDLYFSGEPWDKIGPPIPTPKKYINAINNAANRWSKFLRVSDSAKNMCINRIPNWSGIALVNLKFNTTTKPKEQWIAQAAPLVISDTGLIAAFALEFNLKLSENYSDSDLANIVTHELGHALGIAGSDYKCYDPYPKEIQPLPIIDNRINTDPTVLRQFARISNLEGSEVDTVFPTLVDEYKKYGGIKNKSESKSMKLATVNDTNVITTDPSGIGHWSTKTLYTKNWDDDTLPDSVKYRYSGLYNEIMVPSYSPSKNYYISRITLGRLLDLRNKIDGVTFFNYTELNEGASEVTSKDYRPDKTIEFSGSKDFKNSLQNTEKNSKYNDEIFCVECKPIFINDTNFKKYFK